MGTRGSIGFINQGKFKGVYNHYDSYPDGLGNAVVEFCRRVKDWTKFKENLEKIKFVQNGYVPTQKEIHKHKKFANMSVDDRKIENIYVLLRDLQGVSTLEHIDIGDIGLLEDSSNFIKDSVFCEYAYVLNLDEHTLEFYEGFQKKPQKGNRFGTKKEDNYYPCKLVGSCNLDDIPLDWKEKYYK